MASLIKNQIIKYLSKFTKGLSADKINLSTFKGEGELCNLELDENVLTDLLELPSWLRLTHAVCSRVSFRVPWTKLKSVPIHLSLGEVYVVVETCEELRTASSHESYFPEGPTKYNFTHKVIDSVMVTVETIKITFRSPAFISNVQLSKIIVQSKSPDWNECELRYTRLKDSAGKQILLFKEIEWETDKIEAKSTVDSSLAPIKLLLRDTSRCRIILKKSLTDSSILGTRLAILVDDLFWDLTDFQLKAALHFLDSILGLIQKATEVTRKKKAAKKLETFLEYHAQPQQSGRTSPPTASKVFAEYDVVETSYHFLARQINLFFSDNISAGRSCHPELMYGGSFHVNLKFFKIDSYPYHLALADRNHWLSYKNSASPLWEWLRESHLTFTNSLLDFLGFNHLRSKPRPKQNDPGQRVETNSGVDMMHKFVMGQLNKIMTSCTVVMVEDFSLIQNIPSTAKKHTPKEFIAGDKERWFLPEQEPVIHLEFTYSYFPGDDPFPLPPPKFYVHLNPVQIRFDVISILWLKAFALNLHQSLLQTTAGQDASNSKMPYFDVKVEAIQPRVVFESVIDHPGQKDRPKSLHIQSSRATITNVRGGKSSLADLEKCVDSFKMCSLFFNRDFPSIPSDISVFSQKFLDHIEGVDNVRPQPMPVKATVDVNKFYSQLRPDLLWTEARDVWSIHLEPVFGDFYGTRALGKDYPVPFLDAFPLTLWVYFKMPDVDDGGDDKNAADIHILAHISTLMSIQLNHYQYLFLLRLMEEAKELATYLGIDANRSDKNSSKETMVVGAVIPQVEVTLVMPSQSPGKESSGGDVESVYPDSSSLQDDIAATGNWHSSNSFPGHLAGNVAPEKKLPVTSEITLDLHSNNNIDSSMHQSIPLKTANGSAKMPSLGGRASSIDVINLSFQNSVPFTSFVSSIKKKIDKVMTLDLSQKSVADEILDTLSVRSDASSGSDVPVFSGELVGTVNERFPMDGKESLFNTNSTFHFQMVEVASEVNEDTITSPTSERDSFVSYCRRRDLISLSTFKFGKVEFLKQSEGLEGIIKLQISSIALEECSSIPWDEFQNKFSSRSRDWVEVPLDAGVRPRVRLRMNHTLKPEFQDVQKISSVDRNSVLNWFEDAIDVRLQSVSLNMNASTLSGLSDLVEDEVFPVPFPVTVHLEDLKFHIIEDRPPNNITSPGAVPVDVVVTELTVHRDIAGVIEIRPPVRPHTDSRKSSALDDDLSSKTHRVISENEELRRRLSALEGLSEEYYRLKKEKQETENNFRAKLEAAQDVISELLENKKELLDKLTILNGELQSERNSKR
ncbi:UNVERIFIED_CONTAM: hypothetical protein PYX00_005827 [Menopon gallinae]|uniref:UHRF1-binding protein 1-like n=1 Tax=Menopon gallinae TaxID=328185 RepID=A0AAW2HUS7_9NEOP